MLLIKATMFLLPIGADDVLPYLIYTILLLSPKHVHSNLRLVRSTNQMHCQPIRCIVSMTNTQVTAVTMFTISKSCFVSVDSTGGCLVL